MNMHVFDRSENLGIAYGMGLTAEKVATQWKVSREDQDAFAVESHRRALAAQVAGEFADEICPVEAVEKFPDLASGDVAVSSRTVTLDEGPRADTSLEGLARLRPVFAAKGSVTAGNSSQMSDGAGALIVVSERILKQFNLTPLARFVSFSVRGVPPEIMGIGPKEASPAALKTAGLKTLVHQGPARVFESEEQAQAAVQAMRYQPGDVLVIRNEGPKGSPGMREMLGITALLYGQGMGDKVALLTDGRGNIALDGTANREAAEADRETLLSRLGRQDVNEDVIGARTGLLDRLFRR
jgi:acetyl-CoA acetyltransferase